MVRGQDVIATWRRWDRKLKAFGDEALCLRRDGVFIELDLKTQTATQWDKDTYGFVTINMVEKWISTEEDFRGFIRASVGPARG